MWASPCLLSTAPVSCLTTSPCHQFPSGAFLSSSLLIHVPPLHTLAETPSSFSPNSPLHFLFMCSLDYLTLLNSSLASPSIWSHIFPMNCPSNWDPPVCPPLFYLYPFLVHFFSFGFGLVWFGFLLWSKHAKEKVFLFQIPLFCATVVFGRVTASTRYERKANLL